MLLELRTTGRNARCLHRVRPCLALRGRAAATALLARSDLRAKLALLCPLASDPVRHLQRRLAATQCQIGCNGVSFCGITESPSTGRTPERLSLPRSRAALKDTSPCAGLASSTETSPSTTSWSFLFFFFCFGFLFCLFLFL